MNLRRTSDPISRRTLLRSALVGGAGLAAAYVLGCDDGDGETPAATATSGATEAAPQATTPPSALQWLPVSPLGAAPPPRRDHAVASDGFRLYVFGGRIQEPMADFWAYDIAANAWTELTAEGGPPARFGHNMVWDGVSGRLVVFGGQAGSVFFNDLWSFDPAAGAWTELPGSGSGPAARYGAGGAFDPAGRLLVTHGFTAAGRFDDTWEYALGAGGWLDASPAGDRPIERCLMRAVWDSPGQRLLIFGGQTTDTPFLGDLWALAGGAWTEIAAEPKPSPRTFYTMVFHDAGGRVVLFGGRTADGPVNDLWLFDSASDTWTQQTAEGAPSPRFGHDGALTAAGSLIVFGGSDGEADFDELWELIGLA